jgi:hypothetical protein
MNVRCELAQAHQGLRRASMHRHMTSIQHGQQPKGVGRGLGQTGISKDGRHTHQFEPWVAHYQRQSQSVIDAGIGV